jgi:hypothetical protein
MSRLPGEEPMPCFPACEILSPVYSGKTVRYGLFSPDNFRNKLWIITGKGEKKQYFCQHPQGEGGISAR